MKSPSRWVAVASVVYAALFCVLGADRYLTFHSGADLGIFVQSIASAFHGFHNTFEGGSHFLVHFSPILYLCAPPLLLAHSALALVFVQALATASIAPALYAIARRRTSDANAAALACVALLYPPLMGVTFTDFHETAFAPAAVAWLLYAIDARRFALAGILLAVALSIKEDQAPAMAFLGLAGLTYFGSRRERAGTIFSAIAVAASAIVFVGYFAVVRPLAGASDGWAPVHFYAWSGYAHARPIGEQILGRATYLLEAFVPLAFLPMRSRVLVLALPGFVEVLASREPLVYTMGQHYAAVWVPYVLVAFVIAGARMLSATPKKGVAWLRASAVLCALVLLVFDPLHPGHFLRVPNARDAATNTLIAKIPESASVGTYDEIYAHLGFFPNAAVGLAARPTYVLYDRQYASTRWNAVILPQLHREIDDGTYRTVAELHGIALLQRR